MFDNINFDFEKNIVSYRYIGDVEKIFRVEINDIDNNLRLYNEPTLLLSPFVSMFTSTSYPFSHTNGVTVSFIDNDNNTYSYSSKRTELDKNLYINGNKNIFQNLDNSQYPLYDEVIESDIYKKFEIYKDNVILDVGANIGFFSLLCLSKNIGIKKIYCIEPIEETFNTLTKNLTNYEDKVKLFNFGLSNSDRNEFFLSNGWSSINTLYPNANQWIKIPVKLISADSFFNLIDEKNIDIMKIDVEGSEYEIFENFSNENILRVNKFIIEFHRIEGRSLEDVHNIINKLISLGYFYSGILWTQTKFDTQDWRSFNNLYFKK